MPITGVNAKPSLQNEILALFNQLVRPKRKLSELKPHEQIYSALLALDEKHEINDPIRVQLQKKLELMKNGALDVNQVLTDGPLKGCTIAWVCAYFAASNCSLPSESNTTGYSYLLNRITDLVDIRSIDFTVTFKPTTLNTSALWLAVYGDLKSIADRNEWFSSHLLNALKSEELKTLDVNGWGKDDENINCSALALLIKADYALYRKYQGDSNDDYVHTLVSKVSPTDNPGYYNFNQKVIDKTNIGMTTLCLAGQLEADLVKDDGVISENSPFISILRAADQQQLDVNVRIANGKNKGKTPLWYAAYIATAQVYDALDLIIDKCDIDAIDCNAKAEDPNDDDANVSVLWLASFTLVNYRSGFSILTILRHRKDLTTLDFNNCATSDKDGDKGKTVLWNCALAALNGNPEALTIILENSEKLNLDYTAKAVSGPFKDKSVSDLILQMAQNGNVMPLILMLKDKNCPFSKLLQIPPTVWANLCAKLRELSLEDEENAPLIEMFQETMSHLHMSAAHLSATVSTGEFKNQTALEQLLMLAYAGYPRLLNLALKAVNSALTFDPAMLNFKMHGVLLELRKMCTTATQVASPQTLLGAFLSGTSYSQDYGEMTENMNTLLNQFGSFKIQSDNQRTTPEADKLKYTPAKLAIVPTLT